MSQIAEQAGIGRATLYKYFPDVEAIMFAWHDRQINNHLGYLVQIRDQAGDPAERLEAVLRAYAVINQQTRGHHSTDLGAFLHRDERLEHAQHHLQHMIRELITDAVNAGDIRDDVAPAELATFCLHALSAAGGLPSAAAVRRLVTVTLAGLRRAQ
jgi:AcrR family transcriptional regulator